MKLLHVVKQKFETCAPDLDKFVQIQQKLFKKKNMF